LSIIPDLRELGSAHPWLAGLDGIVSAFRQGQTNAASRDVTLGEQVYQQSLSVLADACLIRIYGTDITARKKAEEELRLARDELEMRVLERTQELAIVRSLSGSVSARRSNRAESRQQPWKPQ
jgi:C4-dicarboxylate-specific signal transduction histidine kinase